MCNSTVLTPIGDEWKAISELSLQRLMEIIDDNLVKAMRK